MQLESLSHLEPSGWRPEYTQKRLASRYLPKGSKMPEEGEEEALLAQAGSVAAALSAAAREAAIKAEEEAARKKKQTAEAEAGAQKATADAEDWPKGPMDPTLSAVLERRRQEVRQVATSEDEREERTVPRTVPRAARGRLQRRATWPPSAADEVPEVDEQTRSKRVAELLLPALKRDRQNAPPERKAQLTKEIQHLQEVLGVPDDYGSPREFLVSRRCDAGAMDDGAVGASAARPSGLLARSLSY
eukprot:TRINITY_DN31940_c0_g1_i1.p1 TRINITY_DN31940_c0_g1~~TRINITY_DN31940_c0_g1_i1.p1  ORF type:complete len:246 (-),score=75.15 TRINITY_DN31940_c0_g1_i1:140-877(-)